MDGIFYPLGAQIRGTVNDLIDYLIVHYADGFELVANQLLVVLVALEKALIAVPPWLFIGGLFVVARHLSKSHWQALGMALAMYLIGCIGLWQQAMQTIAIIIVTLFFALLVGLPIGILSAKSNRLAAFLKPILDLMQTIPSFVYLIPAAMLFGLGKVPAILATFVYATPPLVRLVDLGLRQVALEVVEAGRAFGAHPWQILFKIEIPLALPAIRQGINQTMMMALAMVVVASMIGARGLGETVLFGLQRNDAGTGLLGGMAIVILAIIFDRLSQGATRIHQS